MTRAYAPRALRWRRLWTTMGYCFVALVIYLSLTRNPPDFGTGFDLDFGHVIAYFWLMLWFAQLHRSNASRLRIAAGFFALGVALECAQRIVGYRHFDYFDMLRNLSGLLIGFVLALTPLQNVLLALESRTPSRRRPA